MTRTRKKRNPVLTRMSPREREDAQDAALMRRELAKGGKTYTHTQVMRELGYEDLATPVHKRS